VREKREKEKERNENRSTIKDRGAGGGKRRRYSREAALSISSADSLRKGGTAPPSRAALPLVENHSEDRSRHSSLIPAIIALDLQRGRCAGH